MTEVSAWHCKERRMESIQCAVQGVLEGIYLREMIWAYGRGSRRTDVFVMEIVGAWIHVIVSCLVDGAAQEVLKMVT